MAQCKSCGKLINFIQSTKGNWIPVEATGVTIVTREGEVVEGFEEHWSNCPNADEHRKRKPKEEKQLSMGLENG